MRSVLFYTAARFAIFLGTVAILALFGARGLLLLGLAVLISGIVSFVLLSGQRDAMSTAVISGFQERRRRFERARTKEDG
ncbi:hypothetical protein GCM10023085_53060 [Actinomadura viridis]|uniref:DUF4229 domain-containing protein n=1 Tax=Actinomadura viridis TaxID=58110 RepID=A0A931DCC9_9ACTN|nr:DUF4229 domain-containing protein [Actinomadura viridis]MBG6086274.1 hypothetical protein [Actinomadura viridis]